MDPRVEPVVREANENRAFYEAYCLSLTPPELASGIPGTTWRVKDYIAHLASIDTFVADWFEHQADGRRWRPAMSDGSPFNIDSWNEERIQERYDASVDELFEQAAGHRERLWAAVERFTPEVLDATFDFRGRNITFLRYLQLWVAHDPAHTADMLRGLPEESRTPAVGAWLEKYSLLATT